MWLLYFQLWFTFQPLNLFDKIYLQQMIRQQESMMSRNKVVPTQYLCIPHHTVTILSRFQLMCLINNTFPLNTLEKKKTHNTMLLSVERLHLLATNHGTADSSALLSVYLCSTQSNSLKNFLKEEDKVTYLLCAELADPNHLMRQVKLRSLKMYDSNGYTL